MDIGQETSRVYHRGWLPIPTTYWRVEIVRHEHFVTLGYIMVSGNRVAREMDQARNIVHHEPYDIARRMAYSRWPTQAQCITQATRGHMRRWRMHHP